MTWVWIAISLASVAYFAWLGWRLFNKGRALYGQLSPLINQIQQAQQNLGKPLEYQPKPDAISLGVEQSLRDRAEFLKRRARAKEQRRRRLIDRFK